MAKRPVGLTVGHAAQLLRAIDKRPIQAGEDAVRIEEIASLWSGLGAVYLVNDEVIVKHIRFPAGRSHSEQRDIDSYRVEAAFYTRHAPRLLAPPISLRMPLPLLVDASDDGVTLCISRLAGTPAVGALNREHARAVLDTLAVLHGTFWHVSVDELDGLQEQGCFWHLDTRAEELEKMPRSGWEGRLRLAARALDERLKADAMQTVVHGDCKDANFLFRRAPRTGIRGESRPLYAETFDFQYVGRAPCAKDLAYLFTCVSGTATESVEDDLLQFYHAALSAQLAQRGVEPPSLAALKQSLQIAYADLARWMSGWGWWAKALLAKRTQRLLDQLDGGEPLCDEQAYVDALFKLCPPGDQSA